MIFLFIHYDCVFWIERGSHGVLTGKDTHTLPSNKVWNDVLALRASHATTLQSYDNPAKQKSEMAMPPSSFRAGVT
jgi:hypothetical protein